MLFACYDSQFMVDEMDGHVLCIFESFLRKSLWTTQRRKWKSSCLFAWLGECVIATSSRPNNMFNKTMANSDLSPKSMKGKGIRFESHMGIARFLWNTQHNDLVILLQ